MKRRHIIRRMRRCVTAHDVEPIQAALVVLILAVGALSIATFRALNVAHTNQDRIDAAQKLAVAAQKKLDTYQALACRRGNVLRAYLLVRSELIGDAGGSAGSARKVFEITDCTGDGRSPLPTRQASAFLDVIAQRMGVQDEWRNR